MRILFFFFLFTFSFSLAFSGGNNNSPNERAGVQRTQQTRPNLPGDFLIDFGVSLFNGAPESMDLATLRSRAANIYYLYNLQLGESNFSINPGFGLSFENYMFKNESITLQMDGNNTLIVPLDDFLSDPENLKKSKLNANYFDIPVEIRFNANKSNPSQGFRVAVGGRVGVLFDSKTKIKYEMDDNTKIAKFKESFSLNRFRYGINGRIGFGSFSLFYYQNLSSLFRSGRGPEGTEDTKSVMTGISFALF